MITNYPVLTRLGITLIDMMVTILSFIVASYVRNASLNIYEFGGVAYWDNYWVILINGYLLLVISYFLTLS